MAHVTHWTARSTEDFAYRIASDFVAQIETKLEDDGMARAKFAKAIGVTPGRVSQVLNNPSRFNLQSMVCYARGAGMKVAVIAYEDDDPNNEKGPINSQVFTSCWEKAGKPSDLFQVSGVIPPVPASPVYRQAFYRPERLATHSLSVTVADVIATNTVASMNQKLIAIKYEDEIWQPRKDLTAYHRC